jgi:phosphoribosyl 1,2-cyclic phosphate phosphodiesterase
MKITFLGTGTSQGVPVIACECRACQSTDPHDKRLRASVLVETGGQNLVIDTGPDFRYQMLRAGVKKLDAILLTHAHKDHIAGLDDVRAFNFINRKPIDIYAEEDVIADIRREFAYVFAEYKYPGIPQVIMHAITSLPFIIDGTQIIPIRALHFRLPILGFRIDDFCYITDASYIAPEEMEKMRGCRVLVINALRKRQHYSHFTLSEAINVIHAMNPRQAYITHISHQMGLHAEIEAELPQGISLAFDGLCVEI